MSPQGTLLQATRPVLTDAASGKRRVLKGHWLSGGAQIDEPRPGVDAGCGPLSAPGRRQPSRGVKRSTRVTRGGPVKPGVPTEAVCTGHARETSTGIHPPAEVSELDDWHRIPIRNNTNSTLIQGKSARQSSLDDVGSKSMRWNR
jgi:hypothetical protein